MGHFSMPRVAPFGRNRQFYVPGGSWGVGGGPDFPSPPSADPPGGAAGRPGVFFKPLEQRSNAIEPQALVHTNLELSAELATKRGLSTAHGCNL
jgi:hypothetical protein